MPRAISHCVWFQRKTPVFCCCDRGRDGPLNCHQLCYFVHKVFIFSTGFATQSQNNDWDTRFLLFSNSPCHLTVKTTGINGLIENWINLKVERFSDFRNLLLLTITGTSLKVFMGKYFDFKYKFKAKMSSIRFFNSSSPLFGN